MTHVEDVSPVRVAPLLAPAAQLIEADRGEGAHECKAGRERIKKRQHVVAEGKPEQHKADDGIEESEENHVARHCGKVVETAHERVLEVRKSDLANVQSDWTITRAIDDVHMGHGRAACRCDHGTQLMTRGRIVLKDDDSLTPVR